MCEEKGRTIVVGGPGVGRRRGVDNPDCEKRLFGSFWALNDGRPSVPITSHPFPVQRATWRHFLGVVFHTVTTWFDRQAPKRSSLGTQQSARIKGGFSFIFTFPLVNFCDCVEPSQIRL